MITKFKKSPWKWSILAAAFLVGVGFIGLTGVKTSMLTSTLHKGAAEPNGTGNVKSNEAKTSSETDDGTAGVPKAYKSSDAEAKKKQSEGSSLLASGANSEYTIISDVDFISSKVGFICLESASQSNGSNAYKYKLLKTVDGGLKWTAVENQNLIAKVSFIDNNTGFALQRINNSLDDNLASYLVKTDNGGVSWNPVSSLRDKEIRSIDVVNKNVIFAAEGKQSCNLYRTMDGGNTWDLIALPFKDATGVGGMSWLSKQEGYVLDYAEPAAGQQQKTLYYTRDGGKTWSIKSTTKSENLHASLGGSGYGSGIKFFSNRVGYLGINRGSIRKTTDGGVTFKSITDYDDNHPVPDFINSNEGYAIFGRMDLYHTSDGGENWNKVISADNQLWDAK